ncbi:hypothetical protein [Paraburkholderia oxyphila]|uniref:hypothetical protein n=1 Tax=Paraburkholderia oxyphila TaxID=614212 RepID=UPI0012EE0CF8|nr:hypothetical protein [Paraburkholderia oxyphila]
MAGMLGGAAAAPATWTTPQSSAGVQNLAGAFGAQTPASQTITDGMQYTTPYGNVQASIQNGQNPTFSYMASGLGGGLSPNAQQAINYANGSLTGMNPVLSQFQQQAAAPQAPQYSMPNVSYQAQQAGLGSIPSGGIGMGGMSANPSLFASAPNGASPSLLAGGSLTAAAPNGSAPSLFAGTPGAVAGLLGKGQ